MISRNNETTATRPTIRRNIVAVNITAFGLVTS